MKLQFDTCRYMSLHLVTLCLCIVITFHCLSLHYVTFPYMSLHLSLFRCMSLHFIALRYIVIVITFPLRFIALHFIAFIHSLVFQQVVNTYTIHCMPLHRHCIKVALHKYTSLHVISL